jgi:hypothetical protein
VRGAVARTDTANLTEAPLASASWVQVKALPYLVQVGLQDFCDSPAESTMAAFTPAAAGPALVTVRVQVPVPPTVREAGQYRPAEMSAGVTGCGIRV